MTFDLASGRTLLERTPTLLRTWLMDLPDRWIRATEGPDTWSPFDVVGHLVQGELNDWIPRARIILEHGTARAFEPFDRFAQFELSRGKTLGALLDEFAALRTANLEALDAMILSEEDLDRQGRHPDFGPVTLRQLLATWTVHDQTHIVQIARVMAKQYDAEVGPWKQYLAVLNR
jgi:hypothetical protein